MEGGPDMIPAACEALGRTVVDLPPTSWAKVAAVAVGAHQEPSGRGRYEMVQRTLVGLSRCLSDARALRSTDEQAGQQRRLGMCAVVAMIADTVAAEALQVVQPFVSMMASLVLLPAIVQPPFAQHVPALSAILARTLRTTESYDVAEQLLAIALRALEAGSTRSDAGQGIAATATELSTSLNPDGTLMPTAGRLETCPTAALARALPQPAPLLLAAAIIPAAIAALTSCSEARDAAAVEATASRVVRDAARPCARLLANLGAGEADGTQQPEAVGGAVHAQDATRLAFDHCIAPLAGAARLADRDARTFFWDTLWQQCIGMVLARTPEATTRLADARSLASGLGFLVRFAEDTLPSPETDADVLAARTRPELWEALRMGLHHDADVVRKRSAYLLSAALPSPHPPRWRCFLRLYSVLDEFGTHLVEQAWDDVTRLVPDANAAPATSPAVVSDPAAYDAMLGFDWTMVVWQKALRHSNPNVQRRALTSLIELHGGATLRGAIPCEFVAGAVLPALLSVHHYAPASGAPSDRNWSEAPWTTGTGPAADAFLREWAADCGAPRAGRAAVAWLASGTVMGSCGGGISRTGLSAACGALAALASAGPWQLQPEDARDVLGALTRLALGAASHWDSEFRKAVFCDIAAAACAVAPDDVEAVLLLLDAFPSVARCPTRVLGRSAYPVLQAWLAPPRDSPEAPHRCWRMIDDFVAGPGPSPDTAAPALDLASLDAWERRARQLARLAVVADLAGACETGAMGLATRLSQVYRATYAPVGSAERAMLVLAALLCELEAWLAGRAGADGVASPFAADGAQECDGVVDDLLASLTHLCVFLLEAASGEVTQLALAALQGGAGGDDGVAARRCAIAIETCARGVTVVRACVALGIHEVPINGNGYTRSLPPAQEAAMCLRGASRWLSAFSRLAVGGLDAAVGREGGLQSPPVVSAVATLLAAWTHLAPTTGQGEHVGGHEAVRDVETVHRRSVVETAQALLQRGAVFAFPGSRSPAGQNSRVARCRLIAAALDAVAAHSPDARGGVVPVEHVGKVAAWLEDEMDAGDEDTALPLLSCLCRVMPQLLRDDASAQAAAVAMQIPTGNAPEAGGDVLASVVSRLFRAAYGCCMSGGKRDASATAACLLSATLSAHTFEGHLDRLRALHAPDGPVPWLVTRLTDQASRSTRVARILAAHLGKAVLAVPSAGMRYLGALSTLAQLPASECPVNDQEREFTADLATQSGMRRDGAEHNVLLPGQTALSPAVEARLSATSVAARAAALCCLYELATSEDRDALSVARVLWCALLWDAVKGEVGSDTEYREGSAIHRVKIRLWHAIVVLSSALPDYSDTEGPFIDPDILAQLPADALPRGVNLQDALDLAADPSKAMAALHAVYSRSEHPTIRILAEVTGARVIWQAPRLYEDVVLTRLHDYTARHEGVGSYLVIAASLAMALQRRAAESGDEEAQRALADRVRRLTSIALPWATVCNHGKRALAEVLLHELLVRHFPACADGNPALEAYRKYCSESAEVRRFIRQIAPRLRTFDPGQPITPGELLGGSASVAGPWPPLPLRFEGAEPTFVDAIHAYLMDARQTLRTEVNAAARMRAAAENSLREAAASGAAPPAVDRQRGAIQRKIDVADARGAAGAFGPLDLSWLSDARSCAGGASLVASATWPFAPWSLFGEALAGGGVADAGVEGGGGVSRQGLVVVGTLVDKVPNLAGLARTCEVFRAERLVVSDKKVAKDHMFQSIASSAEHLTPLEEVHQEDLPGWLRAMRAAGYALYGLEQTDSSESLPEARFPDKSVLLLGAEGDGIPAPLLQLMDSCVEIPQLGLVRSLNVHVAGAITVYEYTRQRLTGGGRHLLAGSAVLT